MRPGEGLAAKLCDPRRTIDDADIVTYLDQLDALADAAAAPSGSLGREPAACTPLVRPPAPGGMRLAGREQRIAVNEHRCTPSEVTLQAGGRLSIAVTAGPHQAFAIGRDVEESFVTPAIPAGSSYEWCAAAAAPCRCLLSLRHRPARLPGAGAPSACLPAPLLVCSSVRLTPAACAAAPAARRRQHPPHRSRRRRLAQDAARAGALLRAQRGVPAPAHLHPGRAPV